MNRAAWLSLALYAWVMWAGWAVNTLLGWLARR